MTVALYARRKSWPLEAVTIRLRHTRIHAADCADCETKEGMLDRIDSDLEFAGRLTEEQRSKLLEIAQKCPVHRTLVYEIDRDFDLPDFWQERCGAAARLLG